MHTVNDDRGKPDKAATDVSYRIVNSLDKPICFNRFIGKDLYEEGLMLQLFRLLGAACSSRNYYSLQPLYMALAPVIL